MRLDILSHKPGGFLLMTCVIPLATLAAVWSSFPKTVGVLPLDDAYIHFVYARNLAESGVLAFNPGEPSLGSSSPLWVLLLAVCHLLGLDAYWASLGLSAAAFAGVVVLTARLTFFLAARSGFTEIQQMACAILAALLVAGNGNLHWLALCGMETLLIIFLSLLSLHLYWRQGFTPVVGLTAGLVALGRLPGALLGAIFLILDVLQRKPGWRRGLSTMILVLLPYTIFSFVLTGGLMPTSAKGKLVTYVDSGFNAGSILSYLEGFLRYQIYLPQNIVLLGTLAILLATAAWRYRRSGPKLLELEIPHWIPFLSLALWGIGHLALYALGFRILHHHTRYLAEEYVILAIAGAMGLVQLFRYQASAARAGALLAIAGSLIGAYSNLPYWQKVYAGNVRHVESVHIAMADWIRKNTSPDARVASFDIGVLSYYTHRYMLDLGGLIDPEIHPWLKRRSCGEYLRQKKADYIVYLRHPETDVYSGVYRSTFEGAWLLKQSFLTAYSIAPIPAPTITLSFSMEIYRVEGWYPRSRAGVLTVHNADLPVSALTDYSFITAATTIADVSKAGNGSTPPLPMDSIGSRREDRWLLLGGSIRPHSVTPIPPFPTAVEFTFQYRAERLLDERYGLRIFLVDSLKNRTLCSFYHPLAHGLLNPDEWPVGRVIQDKMIYHLPSGIPIGRLWVDVQFVPEKWSMWSDGTESRHIRLATLIVEPTEFDPIDHWRSRLLSALRREKCLSAYLDYFPQH